MRSIRSGDRGPAVEDVQRRLLLLGYDLGPTGIDGVFLGRTYEAVRAFQESHTLAEDGLVGDETWSALVDATFTLGDRTLYLRLPHFHGRDVASLQQALNALGFACGAPDSIFGAFTERAVREFQRNSGLASDGIVGPGTVRALSALRHVWEGKDPRSHSAARTGPARAADVLAGLDLVICGVDLLGRDVANRVCNLAMATTESARVSVDCPGGSTTESADAVIHVGRVGMESAVSGNPVVDWSGPGTLAQRISSAILLAGQRPNVAVRLGVDDGAADAELQKAAVALLDAICVAFDRE